MKKASSKTKRRKNAYGGDRTLVRRAGKPTRTVGRLTLSGKLTPDTVDWERLEKPAYLRRRAPAAGAAKPRTQHAPSVVHEVASALKNLGYTAATANELASAAHKRAGSQSFDAVFRSAMSSARKNPKRNAAIAPKLPLFGIVSKTRRRAVTYIGQLSAADKKALQKAVKSGLLVKGIGGGYPALKTVYARPRFDFAGNRKKELAELGIHNPSATLAAAARLHKRFIGKKATKVVARKTKHPAAATARNGKLAVARLGTVTYLKVRNPRLQDGLIKFPVGRRPRLLSHPSGRQYYLEGGDQKLAGIPGVPVKNPGNVTARMLLRAGIDPSSNRTLVPLGEVEEIGYFERKAVENFQPVEYYHELGEENGRRPELLYDPKDQQIHLAGGDYRTLSTGINN